MRIGQHHSNVESDLIGSLLNNDSSIIPSSSKIDSLLDEFTGELPLLKSMPPGIDETDYHPENEIRLSQRLLYDNSSPRPPKEFVSENSNADNSLDGPPGSYHPPHPTYETYSGDSCGNNSHLGYDYPPRFPLNYEPEPGYIQNYNSYPHDSPSFPQQYPCCEDYGVTHKPYQCQPKNHDYNHEQNSCCDSNSIGFDQSQPQQYTVNHPIFNAYRDLLVTPNEPIDSLSTGDAHLNTIPATESDEFIKSSGENLVPNPSESEGENEFTPNEPIDSLSMGDAHLNTIPATESDEFIKSSVENLVPNPSESEGENECDVQLPMKTFRKRSIRTLFFDKEINPMKIDQHSFYAGSDLIESMPNHDSSIIISSKIDSLFDEFEGKLTLLKSIPSGIDETDCHHEKETRLAKRLLYDNSSPRPPEEIVFDNSNADIESFSPSPIPNEDSNSHMEGIDLPFTPDDPMPPGIEDDDYDSGRDISILEELLNNYSLSLLANESYHFDIPSPYRPLAKPPDGKT
nr:hypothetical protein [Tanacetum cinerariifolium]